MKYIYRFVSIKEKNKEKKLFKKRHIFENFKCTHPKLTKLNRQIKENIIANKNVDTETENLEIEPVRSQVLIFVNFY